MAVILVVQATPAIRELVATTLELDGHEVVHHDSDGALDRADIELVVLDPTLPGGLRVARDLREHRPEVPLVYLSSRLPAPGETALRPASYLVMPFRLAQLENAVAAALAARALGPACRGP